MASLQYRRCAWLLSIINAHAPITRAEINEYWRRDMEANPYEQEEIPLRTFQKTLRAIEDYFDVTILCNRATNQYSIEGGQLAGLHRARRVTPVDLASKEIFSWEESSLPAQRFLLDAIPFIADRLREHPLAPEQRELSVDENTGLVLFEYVMKPSLAWYEAVRSLGATVRVRQPQWLVQLIHDDAAYIAKMYEEDALDTNKQ